MSETKKLWQQPGFWIALASFALAVGGVCLTYNLYRRWIKRVWFFLRVATDKLSILRFALLLVRRSTNRGFIICKVVVQTDLNSQKGLKELMKTAAPAANKIVLYFHGNNEDVSGVDHLLKEVCEKWQVRFPSC